MFLTLLLFGLNYNVLINGQMQCRDESGKVVDWYVVYKFPVLSGNIEPVDTGYRYAYITNETKNGFQLSDHGINDHKYSIFGKTLEPLYSTKLKTKYSTDISYIDYNDQPPEGSGSTSSTAAHAKGVVAADTTVGFWLIHSVPKFLSDERTRVFQYPTSGAKYGQSALCISLKVSEMGKVVDQLLVMRPNMFAMKLSDTFKKSVNNAKDLEDKNWSEEISSIKSIISVGGTNFTSFSKNSKDLVDLYSQIVAKNLKTDLYVQSWRKNPGNPLDSFCTKPTVENVAEIDLKFANSKLTAKFSYMNDHSKWAISKHSDSPYVCFGDINRMESQYKRGGGTTCLETAQVWKYMNEGVGLVEECGSHF